MKTYFIYLLLNLSLLTGIFCQPYLEWESRFTGVNPVGNDNGNVIKVDDDGNVYVGGKTAGLSNFDYITIKYSPEGDTVWSRTHNGTGNGDDEILAIEVDFFKNVYVTGRSMGSSSGFDIVTIKYDINGNVLWRHTHNDSFNEDDLAKDVKVDAFGNVYVCGSVRISNNKPLIIKISQNGSTLWTINSSVYNDLDSAEDLLFGIDGNLLVSAVDYFSFNLSKTSYRILEIDPNTGVVLRGYNSDIIDGFPVKFKIDASGNIYVLSSAWRSINYEVFWAKFNKGITASSIYNGFTIPALSPAIDFELDNENNLYILGYRYFVRNSHYLLKINFDITEFWERNYNSTSFSDDTPLSIHLSKTEDSNPSIYVTGFNSLGDVTITKYSNAGDSLWTNFFECSSNISSVINASQIDDCDNIYLTGSSSCNNSGQDIKTYKYSTLEKPEIIASKINPICAGDTIILSVESCSNCTYLWSNGNTNDSILIQPFFTSTYTVTVTLESGCQVVSFPYAIQVNPRLAPSVDISTLDIEICAFEQITVQAQPMNGGNTPGFQWYLNGVLQDNNNNSIFQTPLVTNSEIYCVLTTSENCFTNLTAISDTINILVNQLPIVSLSVDGPIRFCLGDSVTILSENVGVSFEWSNQSNGENITVTQSGNYSLTITDANGCTGESEIISVTVDTLPQPIITPDGNTSFCEGGSVQLHGGNFQTYIWSAGETSQNITVSTTGDYKVTVTDSNGCTGISSPITVNVNDILFVEIIYDGDNNICPDESITLQSSVTGIEYSWNTNESTASIIVSGAGTYQLSVTDANGCTGISDQVIINEFTVSDIEIDTIGMTTFCAGDSVILTSSSSATYHWSNGSSSQETTIYNAGNYNVTVTDANGCRNTSDNVTISVLPLPQPVITPNGNVAFCEGGSVILQTSSFEKYKWSSDETTSAIVVDHSGIFVVTVEDSNGCSGISEPISVIEYENPIVEIQSLSGNTICDGDSTTLISSIEGISYSWNTNETTDKIVISTSGTYQLTITDQNGCEGVSEPFEVTVLPLPMIQIDTIGNTAFCSGDSVILRCNEAVAYLWNNGHTTREIKAFTTGSFQVTITGENNCKNKSEIILVTSYSNPVPQLNLSGNISLCTGDSISLFTEEGYVYLWNTGDNSQLINISEEGSYWVNVIDQNGCTGISDVVSLSLDTLPDVVILLIGNDTICQGEMVTLKAINAVSYVWNSGQIGSEIHITVSGQYRVEGTNSQGCSQVESISIVVKENLEPMVTISSPQNSVCEGDLVVFTSSVTNEGINPSYQWFVNGVDQLVNLPEFSTNTLENGTSVFCRMTSDEQCLTKPFDNSNSISVAVNDIVDPKIEIVSVPEILYECLEYEFNADLTNQGSIPEVKWFINGIFISDNPTFVYADFKAGDKLFCSLASSLPCISNALVYSDTISLNVSPLPLPVIIFSNDSISSTNYQSSNYSYNWYVNGQLVSNQQIISCQEYGNGNYYLEISVNDCMVTSQILSVANCTVSSEDISNEDKILVYPNPTTGILRIENKEQNDLFNLIEFYDAYGRIISNHVNINKTNNKFIEIDLSSFPSGVYFFKVGNKKGVNELKIVKI
jgi:hypothetical protein